MYYMRFCANWSVLTLDPQHTNSPASVLRTAFATKHFCAPPGRRCGTDAMLLHALIVLSIALLRGRPRPEWHFLHAFSSPRLLRPLTNRLARKLPRQDVRQPPDEIVLRSTAFRRCLARRSRSANGPTVSLLR